MNLFLKYSTNNNSLYIEVLVALMVYLTCGVAVLENMAVVMFPYLNGIITFIRYVLILLILQYHFRNRLTFEADKRLCFFFIVYMTYILFYITIVKIYPLEVLYKTPSSLGMFFARSFYLGILIYCSPTIITNLNYRLITVLMTAGVFIPSLLYINYVGIDILQSLSHSTSEDRFVASLTLEYACLSPMLLAAMFYNKLSSHKVVNWMFLVVCVVSTSVVMIIGTKRGPILWLFVALLFFFFYKKREFYRYLFSVLVVSIILYLSIDMILDVIDKIAPTSVERIRAALYEGDTSHRMDADDADSCYFLALNQFADSPYFGSYFRLVTNGMFRGSYPHNVFLEIMITMGIFGLIPFLYILHKTFKNIHESLSSEFIPIYLIPTILFLSRILTLMTTGSLMLDNEFWLSLSLVLLFPKINNLMSGQL